MRRVCTGRAIFNKLTWVQDMKKQIAQNNNLEFYDISINIYSSYSHHTKHNSEQKRI